MLCGWPTAVLEYPGRGRSLCSGAVWGICARGGHVAGDARGAARREAIMSGDEAVGKRATLPRVGVGVLVVDRERRVLLTLRRRAPEAGCWSLVGGKLDFMERLEECAMREAREEAGVEVE